MDDRREYECIECGEHRFERYPGAAEELDDPLCPRCAGPMRLLDSVWPDFTDYEEDYRDRD